MRDDKIYEVCVNLTKGIEPSKLLYAIQSGLIKGAFDSLPNYGINNSRNVFDLFYIALCQNLNEGSYMEYEFTEREYNELMKLRPTTPDV